jgi:hypothetical protein
MIPVCSRSDSQTFTPGQSAIGNEINFSRCPVVIEEYDDELGEERWIDPIGHRLSPLFAFAGTFSAQLPELVAKLQHGQIRFEGVPGQP